MKAKTGVYSRPTFRCSNGSCPAADGLLHGRRVVLIANAYQGWKFTGWHGACKRQRPRCVIDAARAHKDASGTRSIHVRATFVPVAPGLTRARPIPIGTAKSLGNHFTVRVNSATTNVQLSPAAPPGAEYFDANLTVTYTGGGSASARDVGIYDATGSHRTSYDPFGNACPEVPQPALDYSAPIYSGQSTSGYICGPSPRTTPAASSSTSARARSTIQARPGSCCTELRGGRKPLRGAAFYSTDAVHPLPGCPTHGRCECG